MYCICVFDVCGNRRLGCRCSKLRGAWSTPHHWCTVPEMTCDCVEWNPEECNGKPLSAVFSLDIAVHVIATLYVMNLLEQQMTIEKETP